MGIAQKLPWTESLKTSARKLKSEVYSVYFAAKDPRTPWFTKILALIVAGYALSPIDLIPDFIPILGYVDELLLLPLGVALVLRFTPEEVLHDARIKAASLKGLKKPTSWIGAAFIVMIWMVLFFWLIALFHRPAY